MTGSHADIGPELRQLAQMILDKLDPAVRLAAARAAGTGDAAGKCQQVWCPVCALAALVAGEQHPLLDVIAEHSVALLTVVRAVLENGANGAPGPTGPGEPPPASPPPPPGPNGGEPSPSGPGRYQHIPVTVEE
ncbi:hypothetical protein GGC64_002832 [Mycobacterium sp. OAS707]|uniref:hypothetical protein n=1 Tax=Mycobacterium sp. OAS707 TaxID=2663822 RepID=UPI0017891409|nr:hypothetical protein [Mycobacterium sp. OAS707]MBE1548808.1 hypothetical protein [Mycobacterium sp. OAS707]